MQLEGLKRKSLLQDLGDGRSTRIGMHDLWREFAIMEKDAGEFECRRWVYEVGEPNGLEEGIPSGGCWQTVKRMGFVDNGLMSVRRVNFEHFSNITVMKLVCDVRLQVPVLELSNLKHLKNLKCLEIQFAYNDEGEVELSSLQNLQFLTVSCSLCIKGIEHLTNLRVLSLGCFCGESLPDLSKLFFLEEVTFSRCSRVATIAGFSSRLSNLKVLRVFQCESLLCLGPGVEDLVALQELSVWDCQIFVDLPDLQKLINLRKLDISRCSTIKALLGVGKLTALQKLYAYGCSELAELPDMHLLTNLQVLHLERCPLESAPGIGNLVSLQELRISFNQLKDRVDLQRLSLLRILVCTGWSSTELRSVENLSMLETFAIIDSTFVDEVPDLQNLTRLKHLKIENCEFSNLSGLSGLTALERLDIYGCHRLERLPDMHIHTSLKALYIRQCAVLQGESVR